MTHLLENYFVNAFSAKRIVEKISGEHLRNETALSPADRLDSAGPVKEPKELTQFRGAGLSSDDYDRFLKSGNSIDKWTMQSHTSPLLAGGLGVLPASLWF
jgi:hypothetical protein